MREPVPPTTPPVAVRPAYRPGHWMMALQKAAGNAAVSRMVVQRQSLGDAGTMSVNEEADVATVVAGGPAAAAAATRLSSYAAQHPDRVDALRSRFDAATEQLRLNAQAALREDWESHVLLAHAAAVRDWARGVRPASVIGPRRPPSGGAVRDRPLDAAMVAVIAEISGPAGRVAGRSASRDGRAAGRDERRTRARTDQPRRHGRRDGTAHPRRRLPSATDIRDGRILAAAERRISGQTRTPRAGVVDEIGSHTSVALDRLAPRPSQSHQDVLSDPDTPDRIDAARDRLRARRAGRLDQLRVTENRLRPASADNSQPMRIAESLGVGTETGGGGRLDAIELLAARYIREAPPGCPPLEEHLRRLLTAENRYHDRTEQTGIQNSRSLGST